MTTYTKSRGETPFDWNHYLDRAISGEACLMEHQLAESYARDWVTCACGNACVSIPRDFNGAPIDKKLRFFGLAFILAITFSYFEKAKEILNEIEYRSSEIIAMMRKEAKNG